MLSKHKTIFFNIRVGFVFVSFLFFWGVGFGVSVRGVDTTFCVLHFPCLGEGDTRVNCTTRDGNLSQRTSEALSTQGTLAKAGCSPQCINLT